MSKLTPMKRLQPHFRTFSKLVNFALLIRPADLNRAEPKSIPYSAQPWTADGEDKTSTKGVESDFIRIYKVDVETSFAFAFTYLDVSNPTIQFTLKNGSKIDGSKPFSVSELQQKMNLVNKRLSNRKNNYKRDVLQIIVDVFMEEQAIDFAKEIDETTAKVLEVCKDINLDIKKKISYKKRVRTELDNSVANVEEEINNSDEMKRLREIKEEMAMLEAKIAEKREKGLKKCKIKEKKDKIIEAGMLLTAKNEERESLMNQVLDSKPGFVANRTRTNVEKSKQWYSIQ